MASTAKSPRTRASTRRESSDARDVAVEEQDSRPAPPSATTTKTEDTNTMSIDPITTTPADAQVDATAALAYWSATAPTIEGVLGGFPEVHRVDIRGSATFLAKLRRRRRVGPQGGGSGGGGGEEGKLGRVADCGAGIGRITRAFLSEVAETVDIVEPVRGFTDQIKDEAYVGSVYNVGLEDWHPTARYDVIWNQWCINQLKDAQVVEYLCRLPAALNEGGWIVVKENLSSMPDHADVYDETDSSVTRSDRNFRRLFERAGMEVVAYELQRGMPKDLYAVGMYALQPGGKLA